MFAKGKLIVDDESYNILRYENSRYQKVAKNGMAYTNVITNPYIIEIETTSETNFFAWAASKALMKPVKIILSHPSEMERPRTIQLYDTLCVGYDYYFNAIDINPMITRLVLSPAIVIENGEPVTEQSWKVTDLSQQNNNGRVQQRNDVENNDDAIELLVKKLEGPFTEDGSKKVEELIMGNTFLYKVTEYNDGDGDKLTNTQWSVEFNNDGKLRQLKQSDAFEKDGVICFKYTPEKTENIRIYAWCNEASKDVSIDVPVVSFPFIIARSVRRAGKCYNTSGEELTREDITCLDIAYPQEIARLRQALEKGYDNLDREEYKNGDKDEYVAYTLDFIEELNDKTDDELFEEFRDLDLYAWGELDDNFHSMIDFFKLNSEISARYEDVRLTNAIANHERTTGFIAGFGNLLDRMLTNANSLSKLKVSDTKSQFIRKEYDETKGGNPHILGIVGLQNLPSLAYSDKLSGLGISVNGTQAYDISLLSFTCEGNRYKGQFKLEIFDHFGLDATDILADRFRKNENFVSWYMLQHLRGYRPFITYIPLTYSFTGTLNGELPINITRNENK